MNIIVAPDSFKGSLSATEVAMTIKNALEEIAEDTVTIKPMADGGEGTIEAILSSTNGNAVSVSTSGPLGNPIDTYYAIIDENIAVIETALHAGIIQVKEEDRDPNLTTTYGIGEAILDALERGCSSFIIGLGGSATNDGGLGMLQALGLEAYDEDGKKLGPFGQDLLNIHSINLSKLDPRLKNTHFQIACDVDNPLCGDNGASAIYGPQKGATDEQITHFDDALDYFANLIEKEFNINVKNTPGAGAAGGLGFAFLVLNGQLESGASLVAKAIQLKKAITNADLVITGEGKSDEQTLFGKAPSHVADLSQQYGKPCLLLSGSLGENNERLREKFAGCFSITNRPLSLQECMKNSKTLLSEQTKQIRTLISYFGVR
ncbi:glycerate kinase [Gracilibacillus dipsosauri]|uniref:Glycerate kinase n=1 Tax=Gracilibacillus dipsosauri TaxID=178340 RepID=A0A317L0U7_9BACI|nr:glycerate kinase [Gracilibacillus dipsosauri]PWU69402.1 glycerate kinase [Gracilibacillus dipsosauri]